MPKPWIVITRTLNFSLTSFMVYLQCLAITNSMLHSMKTSYTIPHFFKNRIHWLLFGIMLIIALLTFKQYGMGWDEPRQREIAEVNYAYVFNDHPALLTLSDRNYGVAFELPLYMIERALGMNDSRKTYLMRHLLIHIFFLFGALFAFRLIEYLYKNKWLASLAFLLLVLHPRLYGHSFFNTKDIPFLSLFIISIFYAVRALDLKSVKSFLILGICCGLLTNMRIMGVMVPVLVLVLLTMDGFAARKWRFTGVLILVFISTFAGVLYGSWPFLWNNPIDNFAYAFVSMSKYPWYGKVLFEGNLINANEIPARYAPVWLGITTPIMFLVLMIMGAAMLLFHFVQKPLKHIKNGLGRHNLMFLTFALAPLLMVVLLNSVLYDGWRQLFFIYPSLCFVGIYGLNYLIKKEIISGRTLALVIVPFLALTTFEIVGSFPYQHVYFNKAFVFEDKGYARKNYEADYWGVSFKNALEEVMAIDKDTTVNFTMSNQAGVWNYMMLPKKQRDRIRFVPARRAKYLITNYRWHPQDYTELEKQKLFEVTVQGNTINTVFRLDQGIK